MSAEILKAKKQLGEVNMLLKQGKLLAAVANLHEAVGFILKAELMKHEMQSFTESLDKAAYHLANDRELKKIYPLQISYKPGEERELLSSLYSLLAFLQENLADEANSHLAALEEYRRKQLELAKKLLQGDETAKAQQVCGRLIDAAKTDTELKVEVADIFLEFGKYDEALEYLKAAYTDNPDSAHVFNKLGMVLRKSGRLEEAEKFYIQALERQTHDEVIYFNLGRVYLDMKRWKNAITAADHALTINAEFAEARKMKMYATKQMGDEGERIAAVMKNTHPPHSYQDKYLNQIRKLVLKVTKGLDCTIFLFGSRARGTERRSSDIDIGFSGLDEKTFLRTRDRILSEFEESIIPHRVDLVNMDTAPPDFKNIAMQEVVVWKQSSTTN